MQETHNSPFWPFSKGLGSAPMWELWENDKSRNYGISLSLFCTNSHVKESSNLPYKESIITYHKPAPKHQINHQTILQNYSTNHNYYEPNN